MVIKSKAGTFYAVLFWFGKEGILHSLTRLFPRDVDRVGLLR
jgi:hypothetical protein